MNKVIGALPEGRYDCHVHIMPGTTTPRQLTDAFAAAGIAGAAIFSENPNPAGTLSHEPPSPEKCMDAALEWTALSPTLFPFYWINPVAPDATDLVDLAIEKGMMGFKVIPGTFMPGDERALPVYEKIAKANKPVVFHSGILWDGRESAKFTRPGNFEALIQIPHLRFALAHISWPWVDECIAVFGKFLNGYLHWGTEIAEMFIDLTPGTPEIYRRDALEKLFTVGYDVKDHVMFGTDGMTPDYGDEWSRCWQERDDTIYKDLRLSKVAIDSIYRKGFERFLFGGDNTDVASRIPAQNKLS